MQNVAWQEIELNDRDQILIDLMIRQPTMEEVRGIFRRLVMTSMEMACAMTLTIASLNQTQIRMIWMRMGLR